MFTFLQNNKENSKKSGKIIAFMNQKGGVGKTSLCYNLAHALHRQGKKVLCLDLDPQANLTFLFQKSHQMADINIFHLMINSVKDLKPLHTPVLLSQVLQKYGEGGVLDLLPSGQTLSGFELTVAGVQIPRQLILKKFIEKNALNEIYDYIVIDAPPTLGLLVVNILCAADGVLYPFIPDSFSQQGLKNIKDVVADISEMGITSTPKTLGYIPNLFEVRRKQAQSDLTEIQNIFKGDHVFEPFANKAPLAKAMAQGKSVFEFESNDYAELKQQFLKMATHVEFEFNKEMV